MWKGSRISLRKSIFLTPVIITFSIYLILFFTTRADPWGLETHKVVNDLACETLPPSPLKTFFIIHKEYISEHATDPDIALRELYGAEEGVKHFINLDAYGPFPFKELPRDYQQAVKKFGRKMIQQEGILPWWIIWSQGGLQRAMEQGDWKGVRQRASHLGHYVADLFMPLHTTANYDGQLTGNDGIHKRLEDSLVDARIEQYRVEMRKQLKKTSPEMVRVEDIFGYSLKGWLIVETILENDRQANKEILGFFSIKGFYYQRLDRRLKPIIIRQLVEACQLLGNIWYSSWLQAGKPAPIIK